MDRDMAQLAVILVDWCGADLDGLSEHGQTHVAQEVIRCLAFTLANSQDAREVLARIVRNEMAENRSRFEEEDRWIPCNRTGEWYTNSANQGADQMRKFIFLIGTTDDFESIEDLQNTYFNGDTDRNMSVFPVEISEACKVAGYDTLEEIATMIGRAEAFSEDWCMDGTFSCLLEA